jgi:murein L,D-transpeptidase YcbB/YkuD
LHQGDVIFDYDEVKIINDTAYIYQLRSFKKRSSVSKIVKKLDCKDADYLILKKFLSDSLSTSDTINYKSILLAMNYRRYINSNHQSEYIVVNIPGTEAEYYKNNKLMLKMRTVVGKAKTPTPTISSYLNNIICFPTWNVPYSIAVKELLPKVQKNENYLEQNSIDVLDAKGNVIEESDLNWNSYNENNFPYYFRQSTGSNNALGVIKFDFQNPFSIFLHATSWQGVFEKENRFLSHGCIRLEKPFELANAILNGELDIEELRNGKKNSKTKKIQLPKKIPVYIIYVPVKIINGKVVYLEDVYHLIK